MCLAIPGKVISIEGKDPLSKTGKIDYDGVIKQASLAYVPEVKKGDYVIVHAGFAISIVDEKEAKITLKFFKEIEQENEIH